jgi:hypothetical protein
MKIDKTGRDTLKSYFVKNAVPTASNFEDLINAGINQREDGIAKLPGEPLSLQADGDDASQKKLLNLYRNFNDLAPAWALALNPRANPADPASANAGFSIGDANGVSRLFIDQATGRLGVGTVKPAMQLDVVGVVRFMASSNANKDPDSRLQYGGNLVLKGNMPQIDFLDTDHLDWAIQVNANKLRFVREPWLDTDLVLDGAGNIGMGTDAPRAKLEVRGGAIMPSFGPGEDAGLFFPPDAAGGSGDRAWLRYYTRGGESTTLELGIANDGDDHIALMASGGVGVGTNNPTGKFHVQCGTGAWERFVVTTTSNWGDGAANQHITIGAGGAAGVMLRNPHVSWFAEENRASIRMGRSGGVANGHWWDIGVRSGNVFSIFDGHNSTFGLQIDSGGTVKVNVLQLGDKWRLSGVGDHEANDDWLRMKNIGNTAYYGGLAASKFWTQSGAFSTSDLRLKQNICALRQAPADILSLTAVQFRWRDPAQGSEPTLGLIAQEVQSLFPEAVATGPDGMLGVNYAMLVAPLIEAVKQQRSRIDALVLGLTLTSAAPTAPNAPSAA